MKKFIFKTLFTFWLSAISFFSSKAQKDTSGISAAISVPNADKADSHSPNDYKKEIAPAVKADTVKKNAVLYGIASFYAKFFEGAVTATGEIFHHKNLTAASNNFKLNTWVRVINLLNGKSIIVRINDRMHPRMAAKGRVVDLTSTAARLLNFTGSGIANVKVEIVPKGTME